MEYICVYNIYICITESLCCTAEINFVNQLYFNKIFFNGDDVNLPHMVVERDLKSHKKTGTDMGSQCYYHMVWFLPSTSRRE